MKKYFSLASALMLALGMSMTSCSNDLDEVQAPAEQQPEEQIIYLSAKAPDSPATRAYIDGVEDSDAIKITGWKHGDVLKAIWTKGPYDDNGLIDFTFDESIHKFVGTLPTGVSQSDVKFVTQGFSSLQDFYWEEYQEEYSIELNLYAEDLTVDIDGHFSNLPLCGYASFTDDELTADMTLPDGYSLVCIHNNSAATITVKMKDAYWGNGYYNPLCFDADFTCDGAPLSEAYWDWLPKRNTTSSLAKAKSQSIDAGKKAYFPMYFGTEIWVNDTKFKDALVSSFKSGKVYKTTYTGE